MSCDLQPTWANVIPHECIKPLTACPSCEHDNWEQFKERLQETVDGDNYSVGHIPPEITLDCPECEEDFTIKIYAVVYWC